jgi:hypothetical protein
MLAIPSVFECNLKNIYETNLLDTVYMQAFQKKMTKGLPLFLHNHNHPNEPKKPPPVHKEITVRQVQQGSGAFEVEFAQRVIELLKDVPPSLSELTSPFLFHSSLSRHLCKIILKTDRIWRTMKFIAESNRKDIG